MISIQGIEWFEFYHGTVPIEITNTGVYDSTKVFFDSDIIEIHIGSTNYSTSINLISKTNGPHVITARSYLNNVLVEEIGYIIYVRNIANANTTGGVPELVRGCTRFVSNSLSDDQVLVSWGANVKRVFVDALSMGPTFDSSWPLVLNALEIDVQNAQTAGLRIVITVLEKVTPSWTNSTSDWTGAEFNTNINQIWSEMAARLLPYATTIYAYDLYNEPHEPTCGLWDSLAYDLITTVRAIDQNVWLVYQVNRFDDTDSFRETHKFGDERIIYSIHMYRSSYFTHQGAAVFPSVTPSYYPADQNGIMYDKNYLYSLLDVAYRFQVKHNVPIYVGEFSVIRWAPQADTERWFRDVLDYFEAKGWSWTYHSFRTGLAGKAWDLEYDKGYPSNTQAPAVGETASAALIKSYLARNNQ